MPVVILLLLGIFLLLGGWIIVGGALGLIVWFFTEFWHVLLIGAGLCVAWFVGALLQEDWIERKRQREPRPQPNLGNPKVRRYYELNNLPLPGASGDGNRSNRPRAAVFTRCLRRMTRRS